jgi:hypothetical protein
MWSAPKIPFMRCNISSAASWDVTVTLASACLYVSAHVVVLCPESPGILLFLKLLPTLLGRLAHFVKQWIMVPLPVGSLGDLRAEEALSTQQSVAGCLE